MISWNPRLRGAHWKLAVLAVALALVGENAVGNRKRRPVPRLPRAGDAVTTFAGNAQRTAVFNPAAQDLGSIRWSTPINLNNTGALAHYGAPLMTAANTVITPVKIADDLFQIKAFNGATGGAKYPLSTDYILPPHDWIPMYQPVLAAGAAGSRLYYPGAGGAINMVTPGSVSIIVSISGTNLINATSVDFGEVAAISAHTPTQITVPAPAHSAGAINAELTTPDGSMGPTYESAYVGISLPSGFSETPVASGLSNPTAMAFAPDGRLFVCEQGGQLRIIKNNVLLSTPFLSLTVDSSGERGLLGVAFDPAFQTNGFVYVYYTATTPATHNRVSRFVADGDVSTGAETVLLDIDDLSAATNHNGGAIHFGLDGKLYVGVGENANGSNAQTLSNLLGKILRINSDGSIPADNPFYGSTSGRNRAIWALGLRNPFTFAFQRGASRIFINDVGESTWEEINDGMAGANYGWPITEGPTTDPRFVSPIFAYGHGVGATVGCAIVGAAFYDPPAVQFPASYLGNYFFADLCSGWIRRLDPSAGNAVSGFATGIPTPVDLAVSTDGSLYYMARGGGGIVNRIRFVENPPPSKSDFSGDGQADIVWRNPSTGRNAIWAMNGVTLASVVDLPSLPNANYRIAGVGDFNSDGKPDLLLRNDVTGQNALWLMNGTTIASVLDLPALPNPAYRIGGVGDFNGDGSSDILWRNASTGRNAVWLMNGTAFASVVDLPGLANADYQMQGSADLNGDGKTDVVWRNAATGQNAVWLMNGTSLLSIMDLPVLPNTAYRIGGIADYNADGSPDLVWRNSSTGQDAFWLLNGTTLGSIVDLPGLANPAYEIAGPR